MLSLATALVLLVMPIVGRPPAPGPTPARAAQSRLDEVAYSSKALDHRERYRVYLPPGYDASTRSYPLVVLLHGLGGEAIDWFDPKLGDLRRQLDAAIAEDHLPPVVAIAPDGHDGYWTDHISRAPGTAYGTFISEVIDDAAARYRLRSDSAAIVGVSMGGHGAMSYGLMHPDRFRAIVSMSGSLFDVPPTHRPIYKKVWGDPADEAYFERTAPVPLLRAWPPAKRLPELWIGCGLTDADRFLPWNEGADRLLTERHIPHVFRLSEGGHGWTTWRNVGREWLRWLAPILD